MLFKLPPEQDVVVTVEKDPTKSGLEGMDDDLLRKYKQKMGHVVSRIDECGLPEHGMQYRLITRRAFNAIEMLQYIAQTEKITDLKMGIYSINFYAAKVLLEMIDAGQIAKAEIMMSNLRNKAYREKEIIIHQLYKNHPAIELWFCSSHAKLMACETDRGNHFVIEGSGNHAYNSRIEQYVIDNDREIYDFTCQWMRKIKDYIRHLAEFEGK